MRYQCAYVNKAIFKKLSLTLKYIRRLSKLPTLHLLSTLVLRHSERAYNLSSSGLIWDLIEAQLMALVSACIQISPYFFYRNIRRHQRIANNI